MGQEMGAVEIEEKTRMNFQNTRQLSNEVFCITLSKQTCKNFGLEQIKDKQVRIVDLKHPLEDYVFVTPIDVVYNWFVSIKTTFLKQVN